MESGVAARVRPTIERYLNVRAARHPSFTSDGKQLAFLTDITGAPQVWQVDLVGASEPMRWPEQRTFDADRVMGVWCSPAVGDGRMVYAADAGGSENAQLFLLHEDGSPDVALTAGFEGALHLFGEWSRDGRAILFAANRRDPALFDLYLQPLAGEAEMIWQNETPGFPWNMRFSPVGKRVAVTRIESTFQHHVFEIDLPTQRVRQLNPARVDARYNPVWYAPDGRSLFVNTDQASDLLYIARLDRDSGEVEELAGSQWDLEYLTPSPDGTALAYIANRDGVSELHLLDLSSGETRRAPIIGQGPGVIAMVDFFLTFSPDGSRLAFSYTSATRTQDVYLWDLDRDEVHPVTKSSHGGIPRALFTTPALIRYPTFDEREIPGWFYLPHERGDEPLPVIVYVHGGPSAQFKPYFHFFLQFFLNHGYAVLAPNVRGSTGYGKQYAQLDDVERRMDSVADLAHAANWLREQPGIDRHRLVVYGGSYGGFMVLAAMTHYPHLWAAGVTIVGISSFVTFLENTSAYRRPHREAEYGSLERDREFLQQISPLNHIDNIRAPLMVIHGANDPRVPLTEAEQLVESLSARSVPVEFIVFDDEGHGLVKLKNKRVAYPAIAAFLKKHLRQG